MSSKCTVRYRWPHISPPKDFTVFFTKEFDKAYMGYSPEWDEHDNKVFDYLLTVLILLDVLDNTRDI